MRDSENIYRHRNVATQLLDKNFGLVEQRIDDISYKLKQMKLLLESLIEEKVEQFLRDNPNIKPYNVTATVENVWGELWKGGPQRLTKRVVITGKEEDDLTLNGSDEILLQPNTNRKVETD